MTDERALIAMADDTLNVVDIIQSTFDLATGLVHVTIKLEDSRTVVLQLTRLAATKMESDLGTYAAAAALGRGQSHH